MDKLISYKSRWFFVSATLLILACSRGNLIETIRNRMTCHGKGVCGGPKRKPVCKCNLGVGGDWCEL